MGTVVAVITAMLLLLNSLNNPFHDGVGGLRPVAMERTLVIVEEEMEITGFEAQLPCDERGNTDCRRGLGHVPADVAARRRFTRSCRSSSPSSAGSWSGPSCRRQSETASTASPPR